MTRAGAALVDITPPPGLKMAGFAARTDAATGAHDRLGVRALALDDIVLLTADVIGLDRAFCARVGAAAGLSPGQLIMAASHTHGGPASMPGRLGQPGDPAFIAALETACIEAIGLARAGRLPARLRIGFGREPGFASNRRHAAGRVDAVLPVLRADCLDGTPIAIFTVCACHPVVLGPDNLLWTADYHHFFRTALEGAIPGALAITATGFAGDVNTGHSASASLQKGPQPGRSFAHAQRMGEALAKAVLETPLAAIDGAIAGLHEDVTLTFAPPPECPEDQARIWRQQAAEAAPEHARRLEIRADWSRDRAGAPQSLPLPVNVIAIGPARVIALPGEIFARTALDLRAARPQEPLFLIGYAGDNPGYIAPADEYRHGGYEIDQAHRFYGMPAEFMPGSAEKLAQAALRLCDRINNKTSNQPEGKQP